MFTLEAMLLRTRRGRGISLVEVIVVITIISAMSAMSVGIFPGVIQFYRARRSVESLMWEIRKVQQLARSRGHAANASGGAVAVFGIKFYGGHIIPQGGAMVVSPDGFSYLSYVGVTAEPGNDLGSLSVAEQARTIPLDASLIPVVDAQVSGTPRGLPDRIQFAHDVQTRRADIIPDDASMVSPNRANSVPWLDFRLFDGDGFFRISFDNQRYIAFRYIDL